MSAELIKTGQIEEIGVPSFKPEIYPDTTAPAGLSWENSKIIWSAPFAAIQTVCLIPGARIEQIPGSKTTMVILPSQSAKTFEPSAGEDLIHLPGKSNKIRKKDTPVFSQKTHQLGQDKFRRRLSKNAQVLSRRFSSAADRILLTNPVVRSTALILTPTIIGLLLGACNPPSPDIVPAIPQPGFVSPDQFLANQQQYMQWSREVVGHFNGVNPAPRTMPSQSPEIPRLIQERPGSGMNFQTYRFEGRTGNDQITLLNNGKTTVGFNYAEHAGYYRSGNVYTTSYYIIPGSRGEGGSTQLNTITIAKLAEITPPNEGFTYTAVIINQDMPDELKESLRRFGARFTGNIGQIEIDAETASAIRQTIKLPSAKVITLKGNNVEDLTTNLRGILQQMRLGGGKSPGGFGNKGALPPERDIDPLKPK